MHLPLDVEVYVLGVVGENRCIEAPPAGSKGQRFLISVKSEETRAAELGSASTWMLGLGVACLLGAVISLGSAGWLARERHRYRGSAARGAANRELVVSREGAKHSWRFIWYRPCPKHGSMEELSERSVG